MHRANARKPRARARRVVARRCPLRAFDHSRIATRLFDTGAAGLALVMLAPLLLVIALAVAVTSRGSVLCLQPRIGRGGRRFGCLRFRTAIVAETANGAQVTPVGRFLRRTSLDELPQLLNILAGQMSVVGPRPIVEGEVAWYGWRFGAYCSVKPGLTGLWQVSGRVDYETRVRLDAFLCAAQVAAIRSRDLPAHAARDAGIAWTLRADRYRTSA
jgi:lipopolysaccharide/colanic/teichoic acid biosynthesis glycosyltransferase